MLRTLLAFLVTAVGLFLVYKMLTVEATTGQVADYHNYYEWAKYAGMVFIAVSIAFILNYGEDKTSEPLEEQEK